MVIFTYSFLAFVVILCLAFYAIWPALKRQHRWRKNQKCVLPELASQWRHHSGTIYTVYDVTNETSQDNRFIISVSYTEVGSGVRWSRPIHDFMSSCEPLKLS